MSELLIDGLDVSYSEVIGFLRINGQIPALVRNLILDHHLTDIHLDTDLENRLLNEFLEKNNLTNEESFLDYLTSKCLNNSLLKKIITRPERIVRFREERWGSRVKSLYLQHKDKYDLVTYRILQSINCDLMQEVFFRIKDGEENWQSLSRQFHPNDPNADGRIGPVPVSSIEPELLEALRQAGERRVLGPLPLGKYMVVAELESFQASQFDDQLRRRILQQELDTWLDGECAKMLKKISLPK